MTTLVTDSLVELAAVVLSALASGGLTLAGVLIERAGVENVVTGNLALGLWEVWMGGAALFAGIYLLGYRNAWHRFREFRTGS